MLIPLHPLLAVPLWRQLRHLGGVGLVLLGLADNSLIPLTGSMDVLTIWLAARHQEPWPYYALMATLGAVIGGYITYSLARKGGKEMMERKLSKKRAAQFSKAFARWGFSAVCGSRPDAAAVSVSSVSAGSGRDAVLAKKIPYSLSARSRNSLLHRGRPGICLWQTYLAFLLSILQTGASHPDRAGSHRYDALGGPISSNEEEVVRGGEGWSRPSRPA